MNNGFRSLAMFSSGFTLLFIMHCNPAYAYDWASVLPVPVFGLTGYILFLLALLLLGVALFLFFRPAGLRRKLLSAFLFVSLLPLCVLAILDQKVTSDALTENSQQVMLSAASQTAAAVDSFILSNLSTVRTEASIPQFAEFLLIPEEIRDGSPEELAVMGLLTSLKRRDQTYITSIAVLDLSGKAIADTYGPDIGSDKSMRDYFLEPLKTGLPYVSSVGISKTNNQPSLYFSCPIRDTAGTILGVLRFRYNAASLQSLLMPGDFVGQAAYSAILFDNVGFRLADTQHPELVLVPAFEISEAVWKKAGIDRHISRYVETAYGPGIGQNEFYNPAKKFFYSSLYGPEGVPTLNVKVQLRYAPWTLVLGYSEATNIAKVATQTRYAFFTIACIVLGVMVTAFMVSRSITEPLLSLTDAARELSKGEEEVSVSIQTKDEIGELADTFNKMSTALYSSRRNLLAATERLQTLLDTLPDSVFIHNSEGRIMDVNKSFEKVFGFTAEEALSLSIEDMSGKGFSQEKAEDLVRRCVEEGTQSFDWVSRNKDGREFPVHVKLSSFKLPEGIHVIALASDITERKQFEHDLMQARNYVAAIIDSMPSILVSVDVNGGVTQWNIQAEKATGILKADAVGRDFDDVMPYLADEMKRIRHAVKTQVPVADIRRVRIVDGKIRYEDVTIYPLVADGVEGAVIRIDDVTERVQLEEMMVQSEKMMSVGGLAAGMAHEINNPLAAIMGSVQNMRKRLLSDMQKNRDAARECDFDLHKMHSYLEKRDIPRMIEGIHSSGERAARIVRNVLNFSRRGGKGFSHYSISDLLDKSLELIASDYNLKKDYDFKNISLNKEYQPGIPPIFCEGSQLQQVFLNLFKNAAEALSDKEFAVEKPMITVRTIKEDGMAVIHVEDNGPGMDEDKCRRVFEPFYTTKPTGKGTGLGLSVSYFIIVDQHGGTMEVFSEKGKWTRFVIKLPLSNGS
ncbi:PAS domain S-box protein [Maridesulfovibrio sp.]|uniref:PAS domain S-box protein n=1 Tax=Maridesulfovibrio sp. TaxID=2795000 RepID=UPI003BAA806E